MRGILIDSKAVSKQSGSPMQRTSHGEYQSTLNNSLKSDQKSNFSNSERNSIIYCEPFEKHSPDHTWSMI